MKEDVTTADGSESERGMMYEEVKADRGSKRRRDVGTKLGYKFAFADCSSS